MKTSAIGDEVDFFQDAKDELRAEKSTGGNFLLFTVTALFASGIYWAANAPLDEVTRGQGRVIPSTAVQTIQNLEGGIVAEILISEGETVTNDQILIRIDDTVSNASLKEQAAQLDSIEAVAARLEAEANGWEEIQFTERILESRPDLAENETSLFEKRSEELREQRLLIQRGLNLSKDQLKLIEPLVERKIHPKLEQLKLERDIADQEARLRDLTGGFQQAALENLNEQRAKLESLQQLMEGRKDRVKRTLVRSPVEGVVNKVYVKTVGGVVGPGEPIVEIVPADESMTVEAEIRPSDIAFLRPGQKTTVKFTAYDFSIYGGLDGTLENISADTIQNEVDGQHYYQVKVRIDDGKMEKDGKELPIIPGMVTEVNVLTGRRTVLQYLLKPFHRARLNALTER